MGKGIFLPATKQRFLIIINKPIEQGAEIIILGRLPCPGFDSTKIHSTAAVEFDLNNMANLAHNYM